MITIIEKNANIHKLMRRGHDAMYIDRAVYLRYNPVMRIGIDAQTTRGQKTGFGFYVENLTKALQRITDKNELVFFYPDKEEDLSTPQRLLWDQILLPRRARKAKVDLLHQPAFSVPILYRGKRVVTIHDVISLFYTNIPFYSRMFYSKWMPFSYHFADHFITISEHSKRDIHEKLGISNDKITVIYLAADEQYSQKPDKSVVQGVLNKFKIERPYILNVGTINPRKNLNFLVQVFARLKKDHQLPHSLVIAGKKGWHYDALFRLVSDLGVDKDVIFTGYVDDTDKSALYHGAELFAFPSIYEGFGLPPLEAMMSGTPVVCSNTSSLPEVIGEGGITLSPHDEVAWVSEIMRLVSDESARKVLIQKGKTQAAKFSWDKCAKDTLKIYKKILQS